MTCTYCKKDYCGSHRLPFEHNCDHKKVQEKHKDNITKNNPIIINKKIEAI